jgi:hypothetical protein
MFLRKLLRVIFSVQKPDALFRLEAWKIKVCNILQQINSYVFDKEFTGKATERKSEKNCKAKNTVYSKHYCRDYPIGVH